MIKFRLDVENIGNTVSHLLNNKGHQRLWLMVSASWVLIAGWLFWKSLPQYQPVDAVPFVSSQCEAEKSAAINTAKLASGEKAYQSCLQVQREGKTPDAQSQLSPAAKALALETLPIYELSGKPTTPEFWCNLERKVALISDSDRAKADNAEWKCIETRRRAVERELQPEANRAVDSARMDQLLAWGAIVFLPPALLPLSIILLLYSVWLIGFMAKWIREGYKRP